MIRYSIANTSAILKANQEIEYLFSKGHGGKGRLKSKNKQKILRRRHRSTLLSLLLHCHL